MNDEHEGLGGSYTLDPKTGKRTLVARTTPPDEAEEQTEKPAAAGFFSPEQPAEPTNATE
ncbi:hypothetical protein HH212_26165 [Massilia forsythiae]|uniref:Uncharacterized protein n=1 Tax=Massilia forsythiae TaxID=2728020 RepID=A0A7Z2W1L6_9BURK|nr:hypothetical protein [Massilia forsythiae]QJE03044.1 hypothetical protein HH212_26165 [Massilia forsythiae]